MILRPWTILLGLLLAAAVLWLPWSNSSAARDAANRASARLDDALRAERELDVLRAKLPGAIGAEPPTADVATLVQQAVREAGLPAQVIAEVSPQETGFLPAAGGATSAAKWKRQSVQVRLNPLALPDIGAFLYQLRSLANQWAVSHTELQAEPNRSAASAPGENPDSVLYRLTIHLTCTYLDKPPAPAQTPTPSNPRATP